MTPLPYTFERLDDLMEQAGIDVLLVSSRHNVQYLLGGYRFFFFDHFDAIGISRYLPLLIYPRGSPERAAYVGNGMELYERDLNKFWMSNILTASGSVGAMSKATEYLAKLDLGNRTIGIEPPFMPTDAFETLRSALPQAKITDSLIMLERLRACKSPAELELIEQASIRVVDSMLEVISSHPPGTSKRDLVDALRRAEINRGLTFEYCLITAGTNLNRAPSDQIVQEGDILSLDSGGNFQGYIGDLCRMAVFGEPDDELRELLSEVDGIQQAARAPIKTGAMGGDIFASAEEVLRRSRYSNQLEFVAHGMGLITHEAPRLTSRAPVPYPAADANQPLQAGMVLSIETTLPHPKRGFVKLEDTVAVTDSGWTAFGDYGRGWNRAGQTG